MANTPQLLALASPEKPSAIKPCTPDASNPNVAFSLKLKPTVMTTSTWFGREKPVHCRQNSASRSLTITRMYSGSFCYFVVLFDIMCRTPQSTDIQRKLRAEAAGRWPSRSTAAEGERIGQGPGESAEGGIKELLLATYVMLNGFYVYIVSCSIVSIQPNNLNKGITGY